MLRLYAGRENIDKERFIYDRIKERGAETLVLVPNQYTLAAEEQALRYLETDCLFDVEILSMNRLGLRVLAEKGLESVRMLDKYGRFMLLTKLIKEHASEFEIFRRSAGRLGFTSMLNDFISEFKQQNCSEEELAAMLEEAGDQPLLASKIKELSGVLGAYEKSIEGKYTDPEDYISMYVNAMEESELVAGKSIWIYGYDSITPKFAAAILALAAKTEEVSFIVNKSDFGLDEQIIRSLTERAAAKGIEISCEEIGAIFTDCHSGHEVRRIFDDKGTQDGKGRYSELRSSKGSYMLRRSETIERIEKYLWRDIDPSLGIEAAADENFIPDDLTVVAAANPYYEAENAAAYIWHLVRDEGYRMRDIQVIANDEGVMQPIVRRVFAEYGLPLFSDAVRSITDTAVVAFIVNLLWFEIYHKAPQFLFAMLKTGMTSFADEEIEELENYVRNYHIKGSMWDRDFKYGAESLGDEAFARINAMRAKIAASMRGLAEIAKADTTADFVREFKKYLEQEWHIGEGISRAAEVAVAEGFSDEAQRMVQSYDKALELLDQMVEILGGEKPELSEFTEIYVAGLSDVEVGVIPDATDGLTLGTMIRTRPRPVRAAVILGANEGTLPMQPKTEGLFSVDEKDFFKSKGFALGSLDDIRINEENAAMYRMMSKPAEKIYISYSLTGTDGKDAGPSPVIDALKALFPAIDRHGLVKRDLISEGFGMDMVNTKADALRHLSVHIDEQGADAKQENLTRAMLKWYRDNMRPELEAMLNAASYDNDPSPLGRAISAGLFARGRSLTLSASALGTYFDCPFKYFVSYGLSPFEERGFSTDSRSVGDAYHECLMAVAERLIGDRALLQAIDGGDSDALMQMVNEELDKLADEYRGGLFISTGAERYRLERIREICAGAASAMASQLAAESVTGAEFEETFGRGGKTGGIKLKIGDDEVYVEGKIDRSDFMDIGGGKRVRVIDYKTGADKLDLWKMRQGYRMQLMIYLISATSGEYEPAGMFYFNIRDPIEAANNVNEKKLGELRERDASDAFKLRGAYINEEGVLGAMPEKVLSLGKESALSREDYEDIKRDVESKIEEIASGILSGEIGIHPLKGENNTLACNYCSYKSICRRDMCYNLNYSKKLEPKPKKKKEEEA